MLWTKKNQQCWRIVRRPPGCQTRSLLFQGRANATPEQISRQGLFAFIVQNKTERVKHDVQSSGGG